MAPPKKRNISAGTGEATAPKRSKGKTTPNLGWEWEAKKGVWKVYTPENEVLLNKALNTRKAKVIVKDVGGEKCDVKLEEMVHVNSKTGWECQMRACIKDGDEYYLWQWQDKKKKWHWHKPLDCIALEKAYQASEDFIDVDCWTVDIKNMKQSNVSTKENATIQRLKTDHAVPDTGEPNGTSKKPAAKSAKSSPVKVKTEPKDVKSTSRSGSSVKSVQIKGNRVPVDADCVKKVGKAQVYVEGKDVYNIMLNQTNVANNNNKYYLLQLLVDEGSPNYSVWFRWGRVGYKGQNSLVECGTNLEQAKKSFTQKFKAKTKNDWECRDFFEKVPGKYDMLEMDYTVKHGKDEADSAVVKEEPSMQIHSKLDKRVQDVIKMICNINAMTEAVVEMKYDAVKAPLGKLTAEQIKFGYLALKEIEKCITKGIIGKQLIEACNDFYTRIPHCFGMTRPPLIRTKEELKAKIKLLEALADIQIALTVLEEGLNTNEHPIDNQYHSLKCELKPLEKDNPDFKMVNQYVQNTHAKTHAHYKLEVMDVFEMEKEGEKDRFKDVGNRMLLWHGSRLTNFAGIMSKGLRIAPPEAPVTGYMFGKGVYFADMSSKSANYCFATSSKDVAFMLLCEVALGTPNELLAADYRADKLPHGKHSVKGLGKMAPDATKSHVMSDGTVVPLGKSNDTGVVNPSGYTLNYNEYIVYNTSQIKMRYLIKLKFKF
ncbi:poly [ADP-ribose] polymerase 2-like [Anneissia japonica]|uniref:poly [ADP-ribose] polymerase 2-like n=1 Tax=Anneissia japonica TaxID=1529436 RepID=UPI0014257774|nr:poly [ADP-ribose] polymerase 2-like [Anneissia japonica]